MVEFVCCKYIRNHRIPKKYRERKNRKPFSFLFHEPVQKMGVEPTRYYYHTDLNRARLPIPPLLHFVLFCCFVQATKVIINEQQRFVNIIF